jgi:hypothetical protein
LFNANTLEILSQDLKDIVLFSSNDTFCLANDFRIFFVQWFDGMYVITSAEIPFACFSSDKRFPY